MFNPVARSGLTAFDIILTINALPDTRNIEELRGEPKNMKISFVILTWNSEAYIEKCICSLLAISAMDVRIYVVDNCSADRTVPIMRSLCEGAGGDRIELIRMDRNEGVTKTRNMALRRVMESSGPRDYVCVLDSDTEFNEPALRALIQCLEDDPSIGVVGPRMYGVDGGVQQSARNIPTLQEKILKVIPFRFGQRLGDHMQGDDCATMTEATSVGYLQAACWVMRVSVLERVGLFDEAFYYAPEDVEFCIRVWKQGLRVVYCPRAGIIHRWQRLSRKKLLSKHNLEHIKGLFYMYRKHGFVFSDRRIRRCMF